MSVDLAVRERPAFAKALWINLGTDKWKQMTWKVWNVELHHWRLAC